jgi:heme oxygenase
VSLLSRFYGFHAAIEGRLNRIAGLNELGLELEIRHKSPLLRQDLISLRSVTGEIEAIKQCDDLPNLDGIPQALGCLYVLEGSTLGGQFICRHLKKQLGINSENVGRYFASYGTNVGLMWKRFGGVVECYATSSQIQDLIVRSACDTFAAFGRWFQEGDALSNQTVTTSWKLLS